MAYRLVIKETSNPAQSKNPKIASMFLTQGSLPFELLWDKFSMYVIPVNGTFCHLWRGHEGRFSVYVHALRDKPVHLSRYFINREICSDQVIWGRISMVNAERRYKYPGLHGNGRYSESMLPEAELKDLRKGVHMIDPGCIAYWSVIHVDWSEGKWHPKSFRCLLRSSKEYHEDSADAALPVERSQTAVLLIRREILS
ncbi:hypothetical protein WN944_002744 [Citrus x changshan-huyou]|uniref:Uncharacterized protein n=1 Tax=Citrus x changshan-huyou TaxID=2935761 RepID=A0AAP0MH40_9ROSI